MSEHTPLPWHNYGPIIHHCGNHVAHVVADKRNADGEMGSNEQRANAEFIVRACNCHDELLAACKSLMAWMRVLDTTEAPSAFDSLTEFQANAMTKDWELANAAIAKAEGKSDA